MAKPTPLRFPVIMSLFFLAASGSTASSLPCNVKGIFTFGSSYVDNGNNNFLNFSYAVANYSPYGTDFPLGPSGRFSNGKTVVDLIGEELGLPPYEPVFTNPDTKGSNIVNGVNFASGGSGILDDTNSYMGVINLKQQIKNFEEVTVVELEEQLGRNSRELLRDYLFVIGTGGNDCTSHFSPTSAYHNMTLEDFTAYLANSLSIHIHKLHDLGARKFVLISAYPVGCSPQNMELFPSEKGCIGIYNKAAAMFNDRLKFLIHKLKHHIPGSTLVYINAYDVIMDIIRNPASKGFSDATTPCCYAELPERGGLCKRGGSTCANRNTHVFFDGVHPTEAVNKLIVKSAFDSFITTEVYPNNLRQLASI